MTRSPAVPLVAAAVPTVAVLLAGAWTPGYDAGADTVSRLASDGQPWAWLVRAALVASGLLVVGAARAVATRLGTSRRVLAWFVGVSGAATVVAGVAPKDPPDVPASMVSQLHVGAAVVAVAALVGAMALVAVRGVRTGDRVVSAAACVLTVGAGAAFPFLWGSALYGVVERVVLAVPALWLVTLARPAAAASPRSQR